MLRLRRWITLALGLLTVCLLQVPGEGFVQLAPGGRCYAPHLTQQAPAYGQAQLRHESSNGTGSGFLWLLLGAVALTRRPFAGQGTSHVTSSNMLVAQPGDAVDIDAPTVMGQVPRRPHVRICERTHKQWKRGRRLNSAAKQRFLVRREPSGRITVWRRQWGQRNLKSKKTPAHLRRLKYMVRIHRAQYKRVERLLHLRITPPKPCDFIMRKFCESRLKDHLGMHDNVGVAIWTSPSYKRY
ncbi:Pentatricopeptide repeat-containing protein [Durusdinium trenchii]|uniref:Chloroplastic n=1 Tax=Durusdinium trenchii TaxID=1381693 RepID=A0ABP0JCW3_9DINO